MKENQRVFAKADVSVHEEFMMLRSSHEVAVQRMSKEMKMEMADKVLLILFCHSRLNKPP